ncbi:MAG: hypothetical protein FWC61_00855, partial [Proteobacteria bacterium]|nr:hypothetical protein [Pseudomonadota bacterium]
MKINQQNLWDKFISAENFELALHNAVRGKKDKAAIVNFMRDAANNLESIRRSVINGDFRTSEYRTMEITDPKPRTIYILPFAPDRIVHHALMNVLAPRWTRMFIRDTYACIPGRGLHSASRRAMEFCRRNEYVLKCDVRKFYPSVRHDVLLEIVMKSIGLIAPSHAHPPKSVISAGPGVGGSARRAVGEAFAENSHSLPPGARESAAAPLQGRGE